jgi:hypothetical protein
MPKLFVAFAVVATAVLCVGATAVAQSSPKVKIADGTAHLSEVGVLVTVRAKCDPFPEDPGAFAVIDGGVAQPSTDTFGEGGQGVECTGRWEDVRRRGLSE